MFQGKDKLTSFVIKITPSWSCERIKKNLNNSSEFQVSDYENGTAYTYRGSSLPAHYKCPRKVKNERGEVRTENKGLLPAGKWFGTNKRKWSSKLENTENGTATKIKIRQRQEKSWILLYRFQMTRDVMDLHSFGPENKAAKPYYKIFLARYETLPLSLSLSLSFLLTLIVFTIHTNSLTPTCKLKVAIKDQTKTHKSK